jgi:hypothetical protein
MIVLVFSERARGDSGPVPLNPSGRRRLPDEGVALEKSIAPQRLG